MAPRRDAPVLGVLRLLLLPSPLLLALPLLDAALLTPLPLLLLPEALPCDCRVSYGQAHGTGTARVARGDLAPA